MSTPEDRLREELRRRADQAPKGTGLPDRIIAAAARSPIRPARRGFPTWTMPLLAAAAVVAIVAGVFVAVAQLRSPDPDSPALGGSSVPTGSRYASLGTSPVSQPPTTGETTVGTSSATSAPSTSVTVGPPDNPVGLANFALTDITFYGADRAWAIGTADCLDGSGGRCDAMVRTSDGGANWESMTQPPGGVTGIRFATPDVGYAWSDSVFEMTTDGGSSWHRQDGGAVALESLDGNVIRVTSTGGGCPGPCGIGIEYAAVGGSTWTKADLPVALNGGVSAAYLVRSDADAYLLVTRNPAGGAPKQQSTLLASHDDGATWTDRGEPCSQQGGEHDSTAVSAAPGSVTVLCLTRGTAEQTVASSTDRGSSFRAVSKPVPSDADALLAGDPATVLVLGGAHSYVSTDRGSSWSSTEVAGVAVFVGFESPTLGRVVTDKGRTIWTTTDAGRSWTPYTFPS